MKYLLSQRFGIICILCLLLLTTSIRGNEEEKTACSRNPCSRICDPTSTNGLAQCQPDPWSRPGALLVYFSDQQISTINITDQIGFDGSSRLVKKSIDWPHRISAIDIHVAEERLYFAEKTDSDTGHVTIRSLTIDALNRINDHARSSDANSTVINGLYAVSSLAVDWISQNLYIAENTAHELIVCSLSTHECTAVVSNQHQVIDSLLVDALDGRLYWSQHEPSPTDECAAGTIESSRLDGSGRSTLARDVSCAVSLHLDIPSHTLYFVDIQQHTINVLNSTTHNQESVPVSSDFLTDVHSVITFGDEFLWSGRVPPADDSEYTDYNQYGIFGMKKRDEWKPYMLVSSLENNPMDMRLFKDALQMTESDPCRTLSCSHVCLMSSPSSASCHCPTGMELDESTGQRCLVDWWSQPSVFILHANELLHVALDFVGGRPNNVIYTAPVNTKLTSLAYDWMRKTLYVSAMSSSTLQGQIMKMTLDDIQHSPMEVLFSNVNNVTDIEVDPTSSNVYWISADQRQVEVARADGLVRTVILTANATEDNYFSGISIDNERRKLYYSLCGPSPHVAACQLDGTDCRQVLTTPAHTCIKDFVVDMYRDELLCTEPARGRVSFARLDSDMLLFLESSADPHYITVSAQHVIWTDSRRAEINFIQRSSEKGKKTLRTQRHPLGALVYLDHEDGPPRPRSSNGCGENNGGCMDGLCIPVSRDHVCLCSKKDEKYPCERLLDTTQYPRHDVRQSRATGSDLHRMVAKVTSKVLRSDMSTATQLKLDDNEPSNIHIWIVAVVGGLAIIISVLIAVICVVKRRRSRVSSGPYDEVQFKNNQRTDQSTFTNKTFAIPRPKLVAEVDSKPFVN